MTDFVAEVSGFPETVVDPTVLITHFEQFGELVEVCLARNYHNTLMYNKAQAKLVNKITTEQKRVYFIFKFKIIFSLVGVQYSKTHQTINETQTTKE